jgi:hypothetical protein
MGMGMGLRRLLLANGWGNNDDKKIIHGVAKVTETGRNSMSEGP